MLGKRKRPNILTSVTAVDGQPVMSAAARLKADIEARNEVTQCISLEPVTASSDSSENMLVEDQHCSSPDTDKDEVEHIAHPSPRFLKLCTWQDDLPNFTPGTASHLTVNIKRHVTIAAVGCFTVKVLKGAININGANLRAVKSDPIAYQVYVPAICPILQIRGLDSTNCIRLSSCDTSSLPNSNGFINEDMWRTALLHQQGRSFSIVTEANIDSLSRGLIPEAIPDDWLHVIEGCAAKSRVVMISGSSNVDISCFTNRLVNRYLTGFGKNMAPSRMVFLLDLDPRNQEYAPDGQVSLVLIHDISLGPNFTHQASKSGCNILGGNILLHAHPMPCEISGCMDYYLMCIENLHLKYLTLKSNHLLSPLLIKMPSLLLNSHSISLERLTMRMKPNDFVWLSPEQILDDEQNTRVERTRAVTFEAHAELHELRTRPHLDRQSDFEMRRRIMAIQSYFHLRRRESHVSNSLSSRWISEPLAQIVPWEFCFRETKNRCQDFVGFSLYDDGPQCLSLLGALTGSLAHVVKTIPSVLELPSVKLNRTSHARIPYLTGFSLAGRFEPLDPRISHIVCTVIIRGFDIERNVVQIVSPPAYDDLFHNLEADRTVIVCGCHEAVTSLFDGHGNNMDVDMHSNATQSRSGCQSDMLWVDEKRILDDMGYMNALRRVRKFQL